MFDNLKKMNELRKMQSEIKKQEVTGEDNGVSITITGEFQIRNINLNSDLSISDQENAIMKAYDNARSEMQKKLMSSMQGMF